MTKILQIIPADGRLAAYTESDGSLHYSPLVSWALVEDQGYQRVAGVDTCPDGITAVCDENSNFSRYVRAADIEAAR